MRLKAMWGLPPDAHVDEDVWKSAIHPDDQLRVAEAVRGCLDPKGDRVSALEYRVIGIWGFRSTLGEDIREHYIRKRTAGRVCRRRDGHLEV